MQGNIYISMQGEYVHGNGPEQVYTLGGTFENDPAPKMIFHLNTILLIMGPYNSPCGFNYKELRMLKKQITWSADTKPMK
jgi:hypothetical protein